MDKDDILSLCDSDSQSEFSGFDDVNPTTSKSVATKSKMKSVVLKVDKQSENKPALRSPSKKPSTKGAGSRKKGNKRSETKSSVSVKENVPVFDVSKLSEIDIGQLRLALGLVNDNRCNPSVNQSVVDLPVDSQPEFVAQPIHDYEVDSMFDFSGKPNIHVEIDRDDISDHESVCDRNYNKPQVPHQSLTAGLSNALFDEPQNEQSSGNVDEWAMPKLKCPEKGEPISQSLASLINTACSSQCDTDEIVSKYRVPENCSALGAPLVNSEIWKILDKKARSMDRGIVDIQNLVSVGIVPVIKLTECLKAAFIHNAEAKSLVADILTMLGQVQYHLSLRRRYMIRPNLKKKYFNLCNMNTPITSNLFGDDIAKEIKNCDTGVSIGREPFIARGRGRAGFSNYSAGKRPYHSADNGNYGSGRYQPYPSRGQYSGYRGQSYRPSGPRGRRVAPTATATAEPSKN